MKINRKTKIIIASSLLLLLIILILLRIFGASDNAQKTQKDSMKKITISDEQLKSKISPGVDSILFQFGIKKEWIKTSSGDSAFLRISKTPEKKKDKQIKSKTGSTGKIKIFFSKEISVPVDLSVAEVNIDINNYVNEFNCYLTASEDPKTGNVKTEIFLPQDSINKTIASLLFISSKELKRDAAEITLVLNQIEDLSPPDADILLSSPEKFTVVMPDDIEKSDVQAKIFDSRKNYLLILDIGSEKDIDADFRSDMKSGEWKSKVKNLCTEFSKTSGIIFAARRSIPKFENDIKEEFLQYSSKIFSDTIFVKFESKDKPQQKITELIKDIISKNSRGYKSIFYLLDFSIDDLNEYSKQIYLLKKQGYKFRTFGDIPKKQDT